ncbi:uncharacterized protein LOC110037471 [Phalaenopsis equestris]|uniref:uncharacterized protein LOC110037471 n=1 Tax=Phalaenopsis equestris TaxID=78828 RepID=UPI0009E2671A|nr:uncharacterized protein LOC110037471 [Phalaenopsis equestris]
MKRFQHSSEIISRYFYKDMQALVSLTTQNIKQSDPSFTTIPEQIANNPRYMSYFKNCIGAIDGTHVNARLPSHERIAYIGRSGIEHSVSLTHLQSFITGKYYLVDVGYPMLRGYLKPYPDTRYHIPDFERVHIVVATMSLHNFIRGHPSHSDTDFDIADDDPIIDSLKPSGSLADNEIGSTEYETQDSEGAAEMIALRDSIADAIYDR